MRRVLLLFLVFAGLCAAGPPPPAFDNWPITGVPSNTTFLRGDGQWAVPAGGSGGAPTTSTYILQTADAALTNAQSLGVLATGFLLNTTTTGVLSSVGFTGTGTVVRSTSPTVTDLWAQQGSNNALKSILYGTSFANTSLAGHVMLFEQPNGTDLWDVSIDGTLVTGIIPIGRISATGTPSSTTYLRGDGTWSTAGGGSGTVTNFSAGDLSPLFTTTEASTTTTPALSFTLSTAGSHAFLGNNTGSTAAPAYVQPNFSDLAGSATTGQLPSGATLDTEWDTAAEINAATTDADFSLTTHNHTGVYEPVLGNPGTTGYVLSSTTGGVRSWIAPGAGGGLATTDIDTSAELRTILTDESGTGAALFQGGDIGAATGTSLSLSGAVTAVGLTSTVGPFTIDGTNSSAPILIVGNAAAQSNFDFRNGTTPQMLNIHNTYSGSGANRERLFVGWSSNSAYLQTNAIGTGTQRDLLVGGANLFLQSGSVGLTSRWKIDPNGHFLANSDNTYDIGASGATRPRNVYVAGTGIFGGAITASNFPTLPADATKYLNGTGAWTVPAGGGGGATIASTTNLIKGDGAGNGSDSAIAPATVVTASEQTAGDATVTWTNGVMLLRQTAAITADRASVLPAASSYAAGKIITFTDRLSSSIYGRVWSRGGSDTLNGGTASVTTFGGPGTAFFVSDGVSAWEQLNRNLATNGVVNVNAGRASFYNAGNAAVITGGQGSGSNFYFGPTYKMVIGSTGMYQFNSTTDAIGNTPDTSTARSSAGVLEINNGTAGKFGQYKGGTLALQTLATAGAPTVTPAGTTGAATWTYRIVAKQADGSTSAAGSAASTTSGNATLTAGNNNGLTWSVVTGASSYDIYRTAVGTSPSTLGKIGNATTAAFTDTGLAGDATTAPTTDSTGSILDTNGNIELALSATASAVNYLTLANGATGSPATVSLAATGSSTNIDAAVAPKGTGLFKFRADGTAGFKARNVGDFDFVTASGTRTVFNQNTWNMASTQILGWSSSTPDLAAIDTGFARNAAGIVEVNNGTAGKFGQYKGGTLALQSLATAGAPTVTPAGTTGAATWTYRIVAKQADGSASAAGVIGSTTTGNATLTSGNNNGLTWSAVTGASSYDIYRTVVGTSPTTTGKIGNSTTASFTDTGLAGDSAVVPTTDNTGKITGVSGTFTGAVTASNLPALSGVATEFLNGTGVYSVPAGGGGGGDASTNTSSSVDNEAVLFSGTAGKTLKRSTLTGIVKQTSGVSSVATAGTDYLTPTGSGASLTGITGTYNGRQILTSGTTYTPLTGSSSILIRMVGGGGGGSGATGAASQSSAGNGGGAGAYLEKRVTGISAGTYVIGVAGTAGVAANGAGGAGGSTTFTVGGTTYTAPGGAGGPVSVSSTALQATIGGAGGAISTNGDLNSGGMAGGYGFRLSGTGGVSGAGGSGQFGSGGINVHGAVATQAIGNTGLGYGSGGSGAASSSTTGFVGGAGAAGVIVIEEYK